MKQKRNLAFRLPINIFRTVFLLSFVTLIFSEINYARHYSFNLSDTNPGWTFSTTSSSHIFGITLTVISDIDGSELEAGDYIGVFFKDLTGTPACAGYSKWEGNKNIAVSAYGDDLYTSQKEGFSSGEAIQWKVWKLKNQKTYDVTVTYKSGGELTFMDRGLSEVSSIVSVSLPNWYLKTSGQQHNIKIPLDIKPSIKGLQLKSGDYIGVFFDSSTTLACGGYVKWNNDTDVVITARGDDPLTISKKEGFTDKELFKWKLWRRSDKKEFSAAAVYKDIQQNDSTFAAGGLSTLLSLTASSQPDSSGGSDSTFVINTGDITFGDIKKASSYRMIGLPCLALYDGTPVSFENTIFPDAAKSDWLAFKSDSDGNLTVYDEANKKDFEFTPGKAFWVISKNKIRLESVKVRTAVISSDNTYSIPLQPGWNMISNPFPVTVDWNEVKTVNPLIADPIWDYNIEGKYVRPVKMLSYKGYYYYNRKNLSTLQIPYPTISKAAAKSVDTKDTRTISLNLYKNEKLQCEVLISFDSKASKGLDDLDQFAPPGNFKEEDICLINESLNSSWKSLSMEARNQIDSVEIYDLKVTHGSDAIFKLEASIPDELKGNEIILLNVTDGRQYDLNTKAGVSLNGPAGEKKFKLIIGKKAYSDKAINGLMPKEYILRGNYPNPFNPSTNISYYLPAESQVTIRIFNMLGEEAGLINNGIMSSGNHITQWNAGSLASGIYLYLLEANSTEGSYKFKASGKLSLLK
ncbi:MAG: T9SS type A sorting domain-containing protein [Bacillota bacterium]